MSADKVSQGAFRVAELVVGGFAFDPLAGEEASTLSCLTILQAPMNSDLAMGDELLKKTGSGNLFMVFGEPDIDVRPAGDGQVTVGVRGLDIYDSTTGKVAVKVINHCGDEVMMVSPGVTTYLTRLWGRIGQHFLIDVWARATTADPTTGNERRGADTWRHDRLRGISCGAPLRRRIESALAFRGPTRDTAIRTHGRFWEGRCR